MNEHHHAAPELTSERAIQEWLKELIENATWDSGLHETEVLSFEETQCKPVNRGLYLPDGSLFGLTIVKER